MLQPDQFQVNEAWIVFQLNDAPIHTEADGNFDFLAVMDAATGLILSSAAIPTASGRLSREQSRQLLDAAQTRQQTMPKTVFVPQDLDASELQAEAEPHAVTLVKVPVDQLLMFIGDARQGFRERFGATGAS